MKGFGEFSTYVSSVDIVRKLSCCENHLSYSVCQIKKIKKKLRKFAKISGKSWKTQLIYSAGVNKRI